MSVRLRVGLLVALLLVGLRLAGLARETAWGSGPRAVWRLTTVATARMSSSTLSLGVRAAPLALLGATCALAAPDTDLGRGVRAALAARRCVAVPGAPLAWRISVAAVEPACFTPLYKRHVVPFTSTINVGLLDAHGTLAGDVMVDGTVTVEAVGLLSCRAFREEVGAAIGARVAAELVAWRNSAP